MEMRSRTRNANPDGEDAPKANGAHGDADPNARTPWTRQRGTQVKTQSKPTERMEMRSPTRNANPDTRGPN